MTWRVLHGRWGATCAEKALCTWIANPVVVAMIPWMRAHGLGRDFLYVILAWPQGSSWTQTRLSDSALFVERDTFRVGHHVSCIGTSRHVSPRRDCGCISVRPGRNFRLKRVYMCIIWHISTV